VITPAIAPASRPVIGLLISTPIFEQFFGSIGISRAEYLRTYDNDWICYYSRLLVRQGFHLRWYLFSREVRGTESAVHEPTGAEVRFLRSSSLYNWWTVRLPYVHHFSLYYATMACSFARELRQRRPDLLYVQDYESGRFDVASVIAARFGIPVVGQYHGGHSPAHVPLRGLRRWAIRRAARILTPNREEYHRVRDAYAIDDGVDYLPHPVSRLAASSTSRAAVKAGLGLGKCDRYVLFLGRLDANHKGTDVLLSAFRLLAERFSDLHLVIAGRGPDSDVLERYAVDLPRVHFLGWVASREQVGDLLSAADVVACPSRFEAFCYVAAEAMAAGRPVVASAVGGLRDLVVNGHTGLLVPPGDAVALAEALEKVLLNPDAAETMGRTGQARIETEFSETVVVPRLDNLLRAAIATGRLGRRPQANP
jgi:glycosyltransferase involved in cell wall biosynthesis